MLQKIVLFIFIVSCSHRTESPSKTETSHFSKGEIILSSMLLMNIHDGVMPPLDCVQDREEAELFLRTIRPRMDEVDIYLDQNLQTADGREKLLNECLDNCTCEYIVQMMRENQTDLSSNEKIAWEKILKKYKNEREKQCLSYIQSSYCSSPLQIDLENEKDDFIPSSE